MTGSDRIFVDTAPLIYLVENNPKYSQVVSDYMTVEFALKESTFFTSTLGLAEFYVKPKKLNDLKLIRDFKETLSELNFIISDLTPDVAEYSAELRAKYSFLKGFDSIQLSSAIKFRCDYFFSNDKDLKKVTEIKVILVDDLIKNL